MLTQTLNEFSLVLLNVLQNGLHFSIFSALSVKTSLEVSVYFINIFGSIFAYLLFILLATKVSYYFVKISDSVQEKTSGSDFFKCEINFTFRVIGSLYFSHLDHFCQVDTDKKVRFAKMEQILAHIANHEKEYIQRLRENVEIASVSGTEDHRCFVIDNNLFCSIDNRNRSRVKMTPDKKAGQRIAMNAFAKCTTQKAIWRNLASK